jgi:hypothetical protein
MHPTIEPTPPCTDRTVHAAVLFEATQFGGIKHWIDGQVGECRGLSGVPVGSIQMVASAGADPFMNPVEDNVQVAFFDDYGCMGKLLGVVAGSNPNTLSLIQQSTGVNSTTGGKVLSARWVAPGVNKPYMNMQFDGKSNPSSGGVATVASGLAGFVAAAVAYLI